MEIDREKLAKKIVSYMDMDDLLVYAEEKMLEYLITLTEEEVEYFQEIDE